MTCGGRQPDNMLGLGFEEGFCYLKFGSSFSAPPPQMGIICLHLIPSLWYIYPLYRQSGTPSNEKHDATSKPFDQHWPRRTFQIRLNVPSATLIKQLHSAVNRLLPHTSSQYWNSILRISSRQIIFSTSRCCRVVLVISLSLLGGCGSVLTVFCLLSHYITSDDATRADLKKLPALPTQALKEHPSLAYWWVAAPGEGDRPHNIRRPSQSIYMLKIQNDDDKSICSRVSFK